MTAVSKNWLELREAPLTETSEISFVRHKHIERISMIEGDESECHVLVHALGQTFLYSTVETMREAQAILTSLISSLRE